MSQAFCGYCRMRGRRTSHFQKSLNENEVLWPSYSKRSSGVPKHGRFKRGQLQKGAKERKWAHKNARASAQESAKGCKLRKRVPPHKNCKQSAGHYRVPKTKSDGVPESELSEVKKGGIKGEVMRGEVVGEWTGSEGERGGKMREKGGRTGARKRTQKTLIWYPYDLGTL